MGLSEHWITNRTKAPFCLRRKFSVAKPLRSATLRVCGLGQFNAYLNGSAVSEEQRQQIEEYWGVNDPPVERYVNWLSSLLHGDMGISLIYRR